MKRKFELLLRTQIFENVCKQNLFVISNLLKILYFAKSGRINF
jgi:hypothetical protein